jgi:hypothetical protein
VQINADGNLQCVNVLDGQSLLLTRRSGGVSVSVEDIAAR